jgi:hypothetical protein
MSRRGRCVFRFVPVCVMLSLLVVWPAPATAAQCAQLFSALSIGGMQYPFHLNNQNAVPKVLSGSVALNLQFRDTYEGKHAITGVSIRYTLDDQPIGPVLTNNFAWTWDTTTASEGTHVLSVLYVNEPAPSSPCFTFSGREYPVVVENTHVPITGSQVVPIDGAQPIATVGPVGPQRADYVTYPGLQPHATAHPYPYQFIPPAGGVPQTDFYSEPLETQLAAEGEPSPAFYSLSNGSVVTEGMYVEHSDFDENSYPFVARQGGYDGPEDDSSISPYATYVPYLDGPGFLGISIDGRLFKLDMDGSVQTLAGYVTRRDVVPFYPFDFSIPMNTVQSQKENLIGNFDLYFKDPLDLAIDPNNHNHIYVADNLNQRIALVDLSVSPPAISTFAGVAGSKGYMNGPKNTALFNGPSSIIIAPDETMYVSDTNNDVIRKIDPSGNVSTVVGIGYPGSATPEPSTTTVANSPLTYAPRSAVPFSSAYINYPLPIRFDSKENIVVQEPVTRTVRYIDLSAQTVTTLAQISNKGSSYGSWNWIDVDVKGNVGAKDDILLAESQGCDGSDCAYRIPITGTNQVPPPEIVQQKMVAPLHNGHVCCSADPYTEYPWAIAIDDQEGRLILAGFGSFAVASFHVLQPSDPRFQINLNDLAAGKKIWNSGTVPNFPFGSRPAFATVHGYEGHSQLGSVMNFDDMVSMTDSQLATYLQSGAEGSVPRAEITGNDLRNLIYFIRRSATGGDLVTPGPDNPDKTTPVITGVSPTQVDPTTMSVSWTTDKQTLGFVGWGTSPGNYFGWSPFESGYNASHTVTVPNLPAGQTIYFVVRSKDLAGNQSVTTQQSLTLQ